MISKMHFSLNVQGCGGKMDNKTDNLNVLLEACRSPLEAYMRKSEVSVTATTETKKALPANYFTGCSKIYHRYSN